MTTTDMPKAGNKQHYTIWYLFIACLIAASLTWWWFTQRIERIDAQIEFHESR